MPLSNPPVEKNAAPSDHGLVGWAFDPAAIQAGVILPTAGLLNVVRVKALSLTITNILVYLSVAGTTLTANQCLAGVYSDAGARLAVTADQATNWQSAGLRTCALTAPLAVTPGQFYRVAWFANGVALPTPARGGSLAAAAMNAGMSAPTLRFSTADSGLTTTLPASLGAQTAAANAFWVGLS